MKSPFGVRDNEIFTVSITAVISSMHNSSESQQEGGTIKAYTYTTQHATQNLPVAVRISKHWERIQKVLARPSTGSK